MKFDKKKLSIVLILICVISLIKTFYLLINDKKEEFIKHGCIKGKIVNVIKYDNRYVYDIKNNYKYRVTTYDNFKYYLGDKVKVCGSIKTSKNNSVFNLFNYRKYLLSLNIKYVLVEEKSLLISKNKNILYRIKNDFIKHIDKYKSSNYLKAFIIADQSMIEKDYKEWYKNLGISHLFAISGMHINFFLLVLNKLIKNKKLKEKVMFIFLLFMLFLTNYAISLIRCVFFLLACFLNKRYSLNYKKNYLLIFVFFILLLFNSYLVYNIGFIFSFTITFFILSVKRKNLVYTSLISFLSSVPILALYYFKVNLLTIIYNLIYIPVVTIIIFPFSLLTFMFKFLDNSFYNLIKLFNYTIGFLNKVKVFSFVISKPNIFMIILYYAFLYLFINKNKKYIMLYLLIFVINVNSRLFIFNQTITYLDIGQGDSSVIILPHGKTILIDTGGLFNSNYSLAKNKIIPYLNSKGINRIDVLILTHGDYDHMGESVNLINNIRVSKVILNCGEFNNLENKLIKALENKKIKYYSCIDNLNIDKYKFQFLNTSLYDNENDNSSVIYFNYKNLKFLFMADASIKRENDILDMYDLNDIDFLKVGHHGSNTSSSKKFIDNINPKYSLISVGENNRYGHPKEEVLDILKDSKIYRTDKDGSIEIRLNKNGYKIKNCKP